MLEVLSEKIHFPFFIMQVRTLLCLLAYLVSDGVEVEDLLKPMALCSMNQVPCQIIALFFLVVR